MRRIASGSRHRRRRRRRSLTGLVKVVRMTEAESFSRSFAVAFRLGEIYDFAKKRDSFGESSGEPSSDREFRWNPARFKRHDVVSQGRSNIVLSGLPWWIFSRLIK
jgi:hypothetical protein